MSTRWPRIGITAARRKNAALARNAIAESAARWTLDLRFHPFTRPRLVPSGGHLYLCTAPSSTGSARPHGRCRSACGVAQVGEGGEDSAVAGRAGVEAELLEDARDVLFHGRGGHDQRFGDPLVGLPLGQLGEHVALAR